MKKEELEVTAYTAGEAKKKALAILSRRSLRSMVSSQRTFVDRLD